MEINTQPTSPKFPDNVLDLKAWLKHQRCATCRHWSAHFWKWGWCDLMETLTHRQYGCWDHTSFAAYMGRGAQE